MLQITIIVATVLMVALAKYLDVHTLFGDKDIASFYGELIGAGGTIVAGMVAWAAVEKQIQKAGEENRQQIDAIHIQTAIMRRPILEERLLKLRTRERQVQQNLYDVFEMKTPYERDGKGNVLLPAWLPQSDIVESEETTAAEAAANDGIGDLLGVIKEIEAKGSTINETGADQEAFDKNKEVALNGIRNYLSHLGGEKYRSEDEIRKLDRLIGVS